MERLITILCILIGIIGLSIGGIAYASDTKEKISADIEISLTACLNKDITTLREKSKAMSDFIEERHGVLSLYVRHDEIEKLENLLVRLNCYSKISDLDDAAVTLMEAQFMAEHILLRELPSAHNVF